MNTKLRVLTGALALAMVAPMVVPTYAAGTGEGKTSVTYDNKTTTIVDPDNPTDPDYTIKIPTAISFASPTSEVAANIELNGVGAKDIAAGTTVTMSVKSANGYKMATGGDTIDYSLTYGSKTPTGTGATDIGTLTSTAKKISGSAKIDATSASAAKVNGTYTDTLTYTATTNP